MESELWPEISSALESPGNPGFVRTQVSLSKNDGTQSPGTAGVARHKIIGSDTPGSTLVCTVCVTLSR